MNHLETVLTARLHDLADEMTPVVDPRRQVADARARHHRQRRGRIALFAVATATAAVVVGSAVAVDLLSAGDEGQVAVPSDPAPTTAPATTDPVAPATPSADPALPAGWEARSFQGVTFAVPPGARAADTVDMTPATSWMNGPSLTWNGPSLGGDEYSSVTVMIAEPFEGGMIPTDGGEQMAVPGAESAYGGISDSQNTENSETVVGTTAWLDFLAGDRLIRVSALLPGGPAGEQMGRDLIASFRVVSSDAGPSSEAAVLPADWESRTFLGVTFAVPPAHGWMTT